MTIEHLIDTVIEEDDIEEILYDEYEDDSEAEKWTNPLKKLNPVAEIV